ncbi:MAG TPA: hypothetical protein VJA16_12825 [Thermoanaerobaculia bacterium]
MTANLSSLDKQWLVEKAEEILTNAKGQRAFRGQTSQLRNLLQIAQSESEITVLRNFVRYQSGRRATRAFWQLIVDDLVAVLEEIGKRYPDEDLRRRALLSFFGYLVRHYVYLSEVVEAPRSGAEARR